ncbi:MAG TPA: TonB family protein [Candidatus Angelobacter sp.]|nr:TonB family protein [Candidatus Angelobacter sp.]
MFLEYFRLREQPFGVTPDPRYLFPSPGHREALASLLYGIETNLGFGALIAQPGMGKTTLLFHILEQYRHSARTAFIFNTQCNSFDLLRSCLSELDEETGGRDTFQLHEKFKHVLANEAEARRRVILVIDEAQNLGDAVMETVRLLSNFESAHTKLLHIILSGQPELAAKLGRPDLSQLQQRIPILTQLPCLSPQDVASYIEHRLRVAGYQGTPLFTPEAVRNIVVLSRGIPREINRLCFNSLSLTYASSKPAVDLSVVEEVAADLGLGHVLRQARSQEDRARQYQQVAVNGPPIPARPSPPRPVAAWPQAASPAPRPIEEPGRERRAPVPAPAAAVPPRTTTPPPSAAVPRRTTLPPIQRIRRVDHSFHGWQAYKRPVGYAVFCFTLIAAGWAAVTHWVHPGSAESAEIASVSDPAASPSPEVSAPQQKSASVPSRQAQIQQPQRQQQGARAASSDPSPVKMTAGASGNFEGQPPKPRANDPRAGALNASLRSSPRSSDRASSERRSSSAASSGYQGPPVKEPSVAAQGQMEFVRYVRPHYPEEARSRHIEGTVVLSAVVARDGTVKGIRPVSGDPTLLQAAETAVRSWIYRPYQINGRAVDVDTEIVINFALPQRLSQ